MRNANQRRRRKWTLVATASLTALGLASHLLGNGGAINDRADIRPAPPAIGGKTGTAGDRQDSFQGTSYARTTQAATFRANPSVLAASLKAEPSAPSLFGLSLGATQEQTVAVLGKPARREPGALGYEWWIYNQNPNRYLQIGFLGEKAVDIYSNAPLAASGGVRIGASYQELARQHKIKPIVSFTYANASVEITNQPKERPLVLADETPVIFYTDKYDDNRVTAIRLIDKLALLRGGFYETKWTYQDDTPDFDPPPLTPKEREQVDAAHERQILDLVNVIRFRHQLTALRWDPQAAQVARGHSRDMEINRFFNHVSASTGLNPFQRLKNAGIAYRKAGENIAAGYPDAIEAVEGWMNSPGHRKNILDKGFTKLGIGVTDDYYTQDFVTPQ